MKTKGSMVATLAGFVVERFGNEASEAWLSSLPEATQGVMRSALASSWYSVQEILILPMRCMCERFFSEDTVCGAKRFGAYAAEHQLTGIYRLALKMGRPNAVLPLATTTWKMLYSENSMAITCNEKGRAVLVARGIPLQDPLWGHATAAWFERALTLAGAENGSAQVIQTGTIAGNDFEFTIEWR